MHCQKNTQGVKLEKKFNSYKFGELYAKSVELYKQINESSSVINQGDSWAPNFLVRETASNEMQVLMLDFQLARCVSPVLDIAFLIYSCTDKELRHKHFDEFLEIYHKELSESIGLLGSDPKILYSWTTFENEVIFEIFSLYYLKKDYMKKYSNFYKLPGNFENNLCGN